MIHEAEIKAKGIELPSNPIVGWDHLRDELDMLITNQSLSAILFQWGGSQAVIIVDSSEQPFHLWCGDLSGRPAASIRNFFADFCSRHGCKIDFNHCFHDAVTRSVLDERVQQSENEGVLYTRTHICALEMKERLEAMMRHQLPVKAAEAWRPGLWQQQKEEGAFEEYRLDGQKMVKS